MRTAKSCGPDAPTLVSSLQVVTCRRRWQKSPVTGESAEETVKTIAQGRPDCFGEPVVTMLVCFLFLHARLRVLAEHPAFPAPSVFSRDNVLAQLGRIAPRECGFVSPEPSSPANAGDPETLMMESKGRGVLDTPHARGMTAVCEGARARLCPTCATHSHERRLHPPQSLQL